MLLCVWNKILKANPGNCFSLYYSNQLSFWCSKFLIRVMTFSQGKQISQ